MHSLPPRRLASLCAIVVLTLGGCFLNACVGPLLRPEAHYDSRQVTIQFLSLYNQRLQGIAKEQTWQGDWVFRRERLGLIDAEMRSVKPDLLILQEMMAKKDSPSASDRSILAAGSLMGYDWQQADGEEFDDTLEVEAMAIATGLPLRVSHWEKESSLVWRLGDQGRLAVFSAILEGQVLTIFNAKLPAREAQQALWYQFMEERIRQYMDEHKRCNKRLIVAGYFAGESDQGDYRKFLQALGLVDASQGFCEKESLCYTATPMNDLYKAVEGDLRPQRLDRILVHHSALVYSSMRNFHEAAAHRPRAGSGGLEHLFPSLRSGWVTTLRFGRCYEASPWGLYKGN